MSEFYRIFKELRTHNNLTQSELATRLNISKSAISMYETGNREPDFETLENIADFFNVDMNYLLGKTKYTTTVNTIAAHHDDVDWTDEELEEIENFKKYVLSKRDK